MGQAINLGGGIGPAFTAGLKGFDSGYEWNKARLQEQRQAAIDTENLRGAGIRNDNSEAQGREDREMFPGELERQGLENTGLSQKNKIGANDVLQSDREESVEQTLDAGRMEAALAKQKSELATSNATTVDQNVTREERERDGKRNRANAKTNDAVAEWTAKAEAATQRRAALDQMTENQLMDEFGTKDAIKAARAKSLTNEMVHIVGLATFDPDTKGTALAGYLNDSPDYKVTGARTSKIDENGILTVYDEDGNVALDWSDKDNDDEPDPLVFDTNSVTDEMLQTFAPEQAKALIAKRLATANNKGGTRSAASTKFAETLSGNIGRAQSTRYGLISTNFEGEEIMQSPTPDMDTEHRAVLRHAEKLVAGGMTEGAAYSVAMDLPDETRAAQEITGFSSEKIEQIVRRQIDANKEQNKVVTRLMILKEIVNKAKAIKARKNKETNIQGAVGGAAP